MKVKVFTSKIIYYLHLILIVTQEHEIRINEIIELSIFKTKLAKLPLAVFNSSNESFWRNFNSNMIGDI